MLLKKTRVKNIGKSRIRNIVASLLARKIDRAGMLVIEANRRNELPETDSWSTTT